MAWTKYKEIRYALDGIPAENLTDFPKLVSITADADIAAELSGGGGIKFTSADGLTDLSFGLYPDTDVTVGTILARVKVSLATAASVGDVIARLYYSSTGTTTENKAGTVSNGYAAFCPLEEDPSGAAPQMRDWVTDTLIGTSSGSMTTADLVTAQVGSGLDLDGTDDYIDLGNVLTGTGSFTVEAIVKNRLAVYRTFVGGTRTQTATDSGSFYLQRRAEFNQWAFDIANSSGTQFRCDGATESQDGTFHGLAGRFDSTNGEVQLFLDGAASGTAATLTGTRDTVAGVLVGAGQFAGAATDFVGGIEDEVRISSVARSNNWLAFAHTDDFTNSNTFTLSAEKIPAPAIGRRFEPPAVDAVWQQYLEAHSAPLATSVYLPVPPPPPPPPVTPAPTINPVEPPPIDAVWQEYMESWVHGMRPLKADPLPTLPPTPLPQAGTAGKALLPKDPQADVVTRNFVNRTADMLNSLMTQGRLVQVDGQARKWSLTSGFTALRAPTATDDITTGALPGMTWVNTSASTVYICAENTRGAAVWLKLATA